jgi:hypothetical protein
MNNNFIENLDKGLKIALTEKLIDGRDRKYYALFGIILPCKEEEFRVHYSDYVVELNKCRACNPPKYDIIFDLEASKALTKTE